MSRTAVVVQARVGSTRLPGKVLQVLRGKTVLAHALARCAAIPGIDAVVCATSDLPQDDPIAIAAEKAGARVFRGSQDDVLARYLGAADSVGAEIVLRVTSDCPLIDPAICRAVLDLRDSAGADYASNNMPRLYPHGLDCEAFTTAALRRASTSTTLPFDREHVTPWLRRANGLKRANLLGPGWPASMHRWTLDYPEDLDFFRAVFDALEDPERAAMQDVLSLLASRPDILALNATRRHETQQPIAGGTARNIVFRLDAGADIGLGHAARCAALQDRLMPLGWNCYWAVRPETADYLGVGLAPSRTIRLDKRDPDSEARTIAGAVDGPTIVVIDHYGLGAAHAEAYRRFAECIVHFDDFGKADLPVDLSIALGDLAPPSTAHRVLVGGKVAPLRAQFAQQRPTSLARRAAKPPLNRVLIAFGGVDAPNASALAAEAVLEAGLAGDIMIGGKARHLPELQRMAAAHPQRLRVWPSVVEVAKLQAECDLAIGAPGFGTWERATVGLPVLMVLIAENQRPNAAGVAQAGAGKICAVIGESSKDEIKRRLVRHLQALQADPTALAGMAERASTLCDGRGAMRIGAALLPGAKLADGVDLRFRIAEPEDETLILDWQLFPETRRYALNPNPPTPEEHHRWYAAKLQSDSDWFLLAETGDAPVGFVRLDWRGDTAGFPIFLISIATAPGHYRRGIGAVLLKAARHLAPRARLLAQVLPQNTASLRLFESLGYRPGDDGYLVSTPENAG
ncbi:MAG TPA: GNAT family N-acetyltransferase [Dongiaceae bacterium]|nr:GNAT family N-acetyltransferase [Dongiaceae bacterium]